MKKTKAVIKEPGKESTICEIKPTLKSLQKIVNGRIEIIGFPYLDKVDLIVNEEGKLLGLDSNVYIPEYGDLIVGSLVAIGFDDATGEHKSLTEEQAKEVQEYLDTHDIHRDFESDSFELLIAEIWGP